MEQFIFSKKLKNISFGLIGIGVIALLYSVFAGVGSQRIWSNLLIDSFFYFSIGLVGAFFLAVQYAAQASWATVFKRIFEAVSMYMPIGAAFLLIVFLASTFHLNHLYHWMDPEVMNPESEHYDALIAHKQPYLNLPFWWIRTLVYLGVWILFAQYFRKKSLQEDAEGGNGFFFKNRGMAAGFLVFFGYTSSTAAWDWIMSIDTHWFSTLFGWYVFSGMWISGMIVITIMALLLRKWGYLPQVNDSHIHDLGKWVFGVSFLWTYLFFSQFMLIWYSNIPEETTYFIARINDYPWMFWGTVFVNFVFPMLLLMSKDAKRNSGLLIFVSLIIFVGHWMDTYMMVTPGTMKAEGKIGFTEIGLFLGFGGIFMFTVLSALAKAPVVVKNHPYLDESIHHHI